MVKSCFVKLSKECLLWVSHLEQITFSRCIVPFKWMDIFRPCWPNLKHLYLPNTSKTSDQDLQDLASLKDIHKFQLRSLSISELISIANNSIFLCQLLESAELLPCRKSWDTSTVYIISRLIAIRHISLPHHHS